MEPGRSCLVCALAVFLAVSVTVSDGLKLPAYIKGCSRDDPYLNECALESAKAIFTSTNIPTTGDRKYHVPVLDPMTITRLKIEQPGLVIDYENMNMYGLKNTQMKAVRLDLKNLKAQYDFVVPELELVAMYTIKGHILVVPLAGKGRSNMTMTNVVGSLTHDFVHVNKKGKDHVKVVNTSIDSKLGSFTIKLDGLFNGDKRLGDHMNEFLNENWKEVVKDIKPSFNAALAQLADQVLNNLASVVPYSEFFPELM